MSTFIPTSIVILVLLAILLIVILLKTAKVVPNQQAYVVERLGKFRTVLYAGFHLLIPFLDVVAYKRSLKEQVLDVPKQTCITRDNVSVDIDGVLYLQVIAPEKSAYGISDYLFGAVQLAQTALRSAIGKLELDKTFEERSTINQEVVAALDAATSPWGIKVLRYEIRDITPPATVMQAMEKQMRAERERREAILQAEGQGIRALYLFCNQTIYHRLMVGWSIQQRPHFIGRKLPRTLRFLIHHPLNFLSENRQSILPIV